MKNMKVRAEYLKICPIDKNRAGIDEIIKFKECLSDYHRFGLDYPKLLKNNKYCHLLKESSFLCQVENNLLLFKKYFKKLTNYQPFHLQIYWAKRLLKGESFSIIAPTGFGKSTFGIIFSLFSVEILKEKKIYYLVPTKILINEIEKRFNNFNKRNKVKILAIQDRQKFSDDFDILITTTQFLHKNFELLPKNFKFIYIDDADSMIRQPKNIDKVLKLIGFNDEEIETAFKVIDTKRKKDYQNAEILKKNIDFTNKGKLVISSATLTPRTKRINLFRELLNFEIGSSQTYLRNIVDFYENLENKNDIFQQSLKWIKKLGAGGFVFLSDDYRKDDLNYYLNFLAQAGVKAISYEKFNKRNRELFELNEIDIVVGFSNIRNPLTRGIDLPHVVRYALFLGIPKFKLPLRISYSPKNLLLIILTFQKYLKESYEDILTDIKFLKKYSFLKEDKVLENKNLKNKIEIIQNKINGFLNDPEFLNKVKNDPNLNIINENGLNFLLIPDARGYIQASGRTSRLYPLGLSQGLSIVLVDNEKLFNSLKNKLRIIGYKIEFLNDNNKLEEVIKKVDEDRKLIKKIIKEDEKIFFYDPIKTVLIIVESPTKAKTIANFFGKPAKRIYNNFLLYEVSLGNYLINIVATLGHFVDLVYNEGIYGVKKNNSEFIPIFEPLKTCSNCGRHTEINLNQCPICNSQNFFNKEKLIDILRAKSNEFQEIYLMTDPDIEGEKIAFDLFVYLYPFNQNIKRIELHEITKEEFLNKFKTPRKLNLNLVCSQITRRIADRWIGFSLSQELQEEFKNLNLSAGRVQTPVLGWLINNDLERKNNKIYFIRAFFNQNNYLDFKITNKDLIKEIRKLKNNLQIKVEINNEKIETLNPPPPLQTSELLKEAWNYLKLDPQTTMALAQNLFERGYITYHRTDSIYVSEFGRDLAYEFLNKNNELSLFYRKSWGKPGTHECIRPTKPLTTEEIIEQSLLNQTELLSRRHLRLYELILKRFIASQCKPTKVKKLILNFKLLSNNKTLIKDKKEIISEIVEEGFNKFYSNFYFFNIEPKIYNIESIKINRFSAVPPYTNASIIDEMKKKGLGRPSTYSLIIQTILDRKYAIIKSGYLIPTNQGKKIYYYLIEKYKDLVEEQFTKKLESEMDKIEKGRINYQQILFNLFSRLFKDENKK